MSEGLGDTAQATPEPIEVQVQSAFAALRAETASAVPEAEAPEAKPETAEVVETAPDTPEVTETPKARYRIGDTEYDEDVILEGIKSGLRQADYTKKTQEVSAERTKLEQERAAERAETLKKWQALEDAVASATPKEPNWVALRAQVQAGALPKEDYDRFAADWLEQSQQRMLIAEERQKAEQAVQADRAKQAEATAKQNLERVLTLIPEWSDMGVRQKDWSEMGQYIKTIAPDLDESALLNAHPALFKVVRDAQRFHLLQQSTEKPKIVKVDSATLKPGSPVSAKPKTSEVDSTMRRLAQTHSEEDAVAAFRAHRQAGR